MKRYLFCYFYLFLTFLPASSQRLTWSQSYADYFEQYKDVAIEQMQKYKIPASITLAQGVLESGAGRSELARKANNHFGIKCNGWTGRKSYHDDDELGECFRAYHNVYESYQDHSIFLTSSPRYRGLFSLKKTDYKGWAYGLKSCGYATSPTYAAKLIQIIEFYRLDRYDNAQGFTQFQTHQLRHGDLRHIQAFNKNYFVVARKGDTFRSIAADVDISSRKLADYNERDEDDALEEGEYVWLKKKRRHVPKEYRGRLHTVRAGDSMYSISQKYGIRLKNLYKMNALPPEYTIHVGDKLLLK